MDDIEQIIHDVWEGDNELLPEERQTIESALREKAERDKGCDYCKGGIYSTAAYDFEVRGKGMRFCPHCGRKLF